MGSLISGIGSWIGGNESARKANSAAALQGQRYGEVRADLSPYVYNGQSVLPNLRDLVTSGPTGGGPNYLAMGAANLPGQMSQAELVQTPGYQFNLGQGLKATQSAAAARGLGVSGAALKGAAQFATGLADNTYQNQFNNAQQRFSDYLNLNTGQQGQLQNQYTRLLGAATLGEQAGTHLGLIGSSLANQQGSDLMAAGSRMAAGTEGAFKGVGDTVNQGTGMFLGANPNLLSMSPTTAQSAQYSNINTQLGQGNALLNR